MEGITMNRLKKQVDFINTIEKLKTVKRQNATLDNQRPENSAEHSWHISMMSFLLLEHHNLSNVDELRVIKMLLIHDLAEIHVGDTFLYDDGARALAYERERQGLKELVSLLPEEQGEEIFNLWLEFEERKSDSAKYAACLDALQPLLNHLLVNPKIYKNHNVPAAKVREKKSFIKQYAPSLWALVEEVIEKSVEKGLYV